MPNPWDRPPFPTKGDDNIETTYAAVGAALSEWEHLEIDLAILYSVLAGNGEESVEAQRAYGVVASFDARTGMIDAIAEVYFFRHKDDATARSIAELTRDAGRFSGRRNDIAHGIVFPFSAYNDQILAPAGFCLFAPFYNTRRSKLFGLPFYIYSSVEIMAFRGHFFALHERAIALIDVLANEPDPSRDKYLPLRHQPL